MNFEKAACFDRVPCGSSAFWTVGGCRTGKCKLEAESQAKLPFSAIPSLRVGHIARLTFQRLHSVPNSPKAFNVRLSEDSKVSAFQAPICWSDEADAKLVTHFSPETYCDKQHVLAVCSGLSEQGLATPDHCQMSLTSFSRSPSQLFSTPSKTMPRSSTALSKLAAANPCGAERRSEQL